MPRKTIVSFALLLLAAVVVAKEEKPSERYAEKEASFGRAVAAKYIELAEEGKKRKLFQFAREAYQEALAYDENNRDARDQLGYVRRGREWVLEPSEAKIPEQNTRDQKMTDTAFDKLVREYRELEEKTKVYAGRKYAGLGTWCEREGMHDQAKKAWEKAIRLDPDNEDAREGLGYVKVDGQWITEKQKQAREEAKEGKVVQDSSKYEGPLGIKLNKMESGHFRVETVYPLDELRDDVKTLETCYAYFLRDVGESPDKDLWGRKAFFLVLGGPDQWNRYVDVFDSGSSADKAFLKKLQGSLNAPGLFGVQHEGDRGHDTTLDGLVHKCGHMLAYHYWNIDHAWLLEGFAYYYTVKVLNSTRTHCTARGGYANPGAGEKDWGDSENWKELVKKDVSGHADPDLRMFYGQPISELQYNASVKAWSMISWLFDKHREKFMKWLELVGRGGKSQEEAMKEVFGWSFEEIDIEWRKFVLETY